MTESGIVKMRLLRDDEAPPCPDGSACRLGLQDKKGELHAGARGPDGKLRFDFALAVAAHPQSGRPVFTGAFASGARDERFVYLSWQRIDCRSYVNRIKARLADLDWPEIRAAQAADRPLVADMSGRKPGGGNVKIDWRIAED
jgi:hypothetical protein